MINKKRVGIFIFFIILTFIFGVFYYEIKTLQNKVGYYKSKFNLQVKFTQKTIKELNDCHAINYKYKLSNKNKQIVDKNKYVNWIMDNSNRCPRSFANLIVNECIKHKNFKILLAIIQVESSFNPFECSKLNARGLGQIRPFYYDKKGNPVDVWYNELKENNIISNPKDLYDPVCNIKAMNYILTKYLNETDDLKNALYKYLGHKNDKYVNKVLKNIGELAIL